MPSTGNFASRGDIPNNFIGESMFTEERMRHRLPDESEWHDHLSLEAFDLCGRVYALNREVKAFRASQQAMRDLNEELRQRVRRSEDRAARAEAQFAGAIGADSYDAWISRPPSRPAPPQLATVFGQVLEEFWRAKDKHGEKTMDGPGYTSEQRLAILVEEGGEVSEEVANAALQAIIGRVGHALTYDQPGVEGGHLGRLHKELIQTAAMAVTWASTLMPGEAESESVPFSDGRYVIPMPCFSCGRNLSVALHAPGCEESSSGDRR